MDKTRVALVLVTEDSISAPLVEVDALNSLVPDLLIAVSNLSKYIPLMCLCEGQVVTGVIYTKDCISIQGQPVKEKT